jgi:hypothetical protein
LTVVFKKIKGFVNIMDSPAATILHFACAD